MTTVKATPAEPVLTAGEKVIKDVLVKELKGASVQVQDVSGACTPLICLTTTATDGDRNQRGVRLILFGSRFSQFIQRIIDH